MNQSAVVPRLDLVGGRPVTTSLNVAEVFGKQHQHVLRAIRTMDVPEDFAASTFGRGSYLDDNNQSRPMYHITRDGFTLLAMGFTGKAAMQFKLAYIEAFNRMEAELAKPAGKRADIFHHRGPVSDSGLDIRYTLDLTKIITNPKPNTLALLQRLTGIDTSDLPVEDEQGARSLLYAEQQQVLADFAAENLIADAQGVTRFAALRQRLQSWYAATIDTALPPPSSRALSSWLRSAGYTIRKPCGNATVYGLRLVEVQP